MTKNTTARNALRAAVTSALIVIATGVGVQTGWADEVAGTVTPPAASTGTTGDDTTDNNPWD